MKIKLNTLPFSTNLCQWEQRNPHVTKIEYGASDFVRLLQWAYGLRPLKYPRKLR